MHTGGQTSETSVLHRLNPAVKLTVFLSIIQIAGMSGTLKSYTVLTVAAVCVQMWARIGLLDVFRKVKPFIIILIFTFTMNFFFASGLNSSLSLTYRFFLIIYFSILLSETTDERALVSLLSLPIRGKAGKNLRVVMLVALEFIPIFIEDAKRTVKLITLSPQYEKHAYRVLFRPNEYIRPLMHSLLAHTDTVAKKVEEGGYASVPVEMPSIYEMLVALGAVSAAVIYYAL